MSNYGHFGATVGAVLRHLPGALASDFAQHRPVVAAGASTTVLQLDSTTGLAPGDAVNVNTGVFPPEGETAVVETVDSATQLTLASALSSAPVSGDVLNDGPSVVGAALDDAEALVEAHLPDRYRRLLRRVEGEIVVAAASPSQATATVALGAASNLVLYPDHVGPYADRVRADRMDESLYSLGGDGVTITFSPALSENARVAADYDHTLADGIAVLADLTAALAAVQLTAYLHGHTDEWVRSLERVARERLATLGDGRCGVPELDAIRLVDDWERAARGTRVGRLERS